MMRQAQITRMKTDSWRGFHTPRLCRGYKGMKPESDTFREQPYPVRSAAGLVDFFALFCFRFFFPALFASLFFLSCGGRREVPYTLAPREGVVVSAEAAAALAGDFIDGSEGELKPRPNADGSVSVTGADGGELVRFYAFETEEGPETIGVTPEGYYRASRRGADCLMVKTTQRDYSLGQFAEVLFRPDLPAKPPKAGSAGPDTLAGILTAKAPPSIQGPLGVTVQDGELRLNFTVTGEPGSGIGKLALFYRDLLGGEYPAAMLDAGRFVRETRRAGGKTIYDISLPVPDTPKFGLSGLAGVSVFNGDNSAASERLWAEIPGRGETLKPSGKPVLHVCAASAGAAEDFGALEAVFARQDSGALYRAVRVLGFPGPDPGRKGFFRVFNAEFAAGVGEGDVVVCILSFPGTLSSIDGRGDFRFSLPGSAGEETLDKWDLAAAFASLNTQKVLVLLDLQGSPETPAREAAFLRLRDWLGPGVFLGFGSPEAEDRDRVMPALLEAAGGAWAGNRRYLGAVEFARFVQKALPASVAFFPAEDFPLIDRFYASGELRMQTMFSGTVLIEGFDTQGRPLTFGETQTRLLPPGTYSLQMTYRDRHREIKRAEIKNVQAAWVVFTYTPELLAGDLRGRLPGFGVDIAELNPGNYKKTGAEILEKLDLPPYYAAFLSGEQLYRSGDYDKAIGEYTRSISLKGDYTEAFVSRGNAWRRKGETNRAIADYSRALSLKGDYTED